VAIGSIAAILSEGRGFSAMIPAAVAGRLTRIAARFASILCKIAE
jgi:hypothetical protein